MFQLFIVGGFLFAAGLLVYFLEMRDRKKIKYQYDKEKFVIVSSALQYGSVEDFKNADPLNYHRAVEKEMIPTIEELITIQKNLFDEKPD